MPRLTHPVRSAVWGESRRQRSCRRGFDPQRWQWVGECQPADACRLSVVRRRHQYARTVRHGFPLELSTPDRMRHLFSRQHPNICPARTCRRTDNRVQSYVLAKLPVVAADVGGRGPAVRGAAAASLALYTYNPLVLYNGVFWGASTPPLWSSCCWLWRAIARASSRPPTPLRSRPRHSRSSCYRSWPWVEIGRHPAAFSWRVRSSCCCPCPTSLQIPVG